MLKTLSSGHVRQILRPATELSTALMLRYRRAGPRTTPTVVIPGGPGPASILPYRGLLLRQLPRLRIWARRPDRVAGMLLESALQSTADLASERD
ncbi:hypothetical protein G7067_02620 [Leucobacter insecticola]|uniref:Uncharacterized protein n=1 Tax=Leucobacter insecticola TaxID=2714934 RepID=A0A6G8FHN9_9MICO|nr:hypothetical protein [Leucobacter insecticola]QIM15552.1 hypothetical protein G7067_02620 [Leucobacter insecticola]